LTLYIAGSRVTITSENTAGFYEQEAKIAMKRIVVIGTGGAGLVSAIAARKAGAEVIVLSKTSRGSASCTAYSAGIFSLACGGVTPQEHYEKTLSVGGRINDKELVKVLAEEAEVTLKTLLDWGVQIKLGHGTASARASAPNELMGGGGFQKELVTIAERVGVKFEDWTVVTSLCIKNGRVTGVNAQNWRTGKTQVIDAGGVILATGGGGQIYLYTDNPARITGDGYALALNAGLTLRDMEFVQFYPIGWAEPNFPHWMADVALVDYLRITDADDHEFLKEALFSWGYKNGREGNMYARDKCAILMAEKDRSGGVYAHIEDLTEEQWADPQLRYCLTLDVRFFNNHRRPIKVAPLEHYFCGGINIDSYGHTAVKGLYACGEVTGGVDGANRIGGNALSNIVTFGLRAGTTAFSECEMLVSAEPVSSKFNGLLPCSDSGEKPETLRRELQKKVWNAIGPVRYTDEMSDCLAYLSDFKKRKISIDTPMDRLYALEMEGLVLTAEAVSNAALKRQENIGTHYRVSR
jgi:succinate dehydrogenase/fumarate reductase flavoprotein subunit